MSDLLNDLRAVLKTTPARWTDLIQTLPVELLTTRPAPQEWSSGECLQHLIDVEKVFRFRLQAFMEGRDFPGFNPDEEGSQGTGPSEHEDLAELAAEFSRQRLESLHALESISEQDLNRTSRHTELGQVTLRQMLNEWAAHDLNHTIQAERVVMQPFIRACGPWQMYFTTHIIPVA